MLLGGLFVTAIAVPSFAADTRDRKMNLWNVSSLVEPGELKSERDWLRGYWHELLRPAKDGSKKRRGDAIVSGNGFHFVYGGRSSEEFLAGWKLTHLEDNSIKGIELRRMVRTDPDSGLQCTLELKEYSEFPVAEWVLRFKNTGTKPTPVLEDIRSLDLSVAASDNLLLHHNEGDFYFAESFQPLAETIPAGQSRRYAPIGGRPTNHAWPYFNIENPDLKQGLIAAVGWPGQWSADFKRSAEQSGVLHVQGGQELTHFSLLPGEEVRTPLSVVMFYHGDSVRGQNLWRRWMLAHNMPHPGGKLPGPVFSTCLGLHQSEKTEKDGIDTYSKNGADLNQWWMDAGWYPCGTGWWNVGTWQPDPERFPNGIRPVSDYAKQHGMSLVLWFEPERVTPGSRLYVEHPDWLLGADGGNKLFNLGNEQARKWLTDYVDHFMTEQGVSIYRQDFNMDALPYWRANDAPDRQGITEIKHVEGYLAYFDELRRRRPGLLIDTCASGGRRLDLETLRRAVPLLRSDFQFHPMANQAHTYGIASWLPYFGTGVFNETPYMVRSHMVPAFGFGAKEKDNDWAQFRREAAIWRKILPDMLGDYYPLLPYSLDEQAWIAWQWNRPDLGTGAVQVFRRENSPLVAVQFRLHALEPSAIYEIADADAPGAAPRTFTGKELMEAGLPVHLDTRPSAGIYTYRRRKERR